MVVLPMNWFGVALILLAFALLIVDLKVTNHGLPTVGGLGALVLGILILFDASGPYFWVLLVIMGALREVLAARGRPVTTGMEAMIGEVGIVKEPIGTGFPGWVFVHGEWWRAVAAIAPEEAHKRQRERVIDIGCRVQVVGFRDGEVVVMPFGSTALEYPPRS
jgi:membrane-bound serine protease (ClpP class)